MTTEKYRPSNGTEGEGFISAWCCKCERDINDDCPIVAATFCYDVDDPEYPKEWVRDKSGPRCSAFVPLGEPVPTARCSQTQDMFGGDA